MDIDKNEILSKSEIAPIIGQRIKATRESMKISLSDFARKSGISPSFLSEIEHGTKCPNLYTFFKICTENNLSADKIVYGDEISLLDIIVDNCNCLDLEDIDRLIAYLRSFREIISD